MQINVEVQHFVRLSTGFIRVTGHVDGQPNQPVSFLVRGDDPRFQVKPQDVPERTLANDGK